jgi:hypothetical protein
MTVVARGGAHISKRPRLARSKRKTSDYRYCCAEVGRAEVSPLEPGGADAVGAGAETEAEANEITIGGNLAGDDEILSTAENSFASIFEWHKAASSSIEPNEAIRN